MNVLFFQKKSLVNQKWKFCSVDADAKIPISKFPNDQKHNRTGSEHDITQIEISNIYLNSSYWEKIIVLKTSIFQA